MGQKATCKRGHTATLSSVKWAYEELKDDPDKYCAKAKKAIVAEYKRVTETTEYKRAMANQKSRGYTNWPNIYTCCGDKFGTHGCVVFFFPLFLKFVFV